MQEIVFDSSLPIAIGSDHAGIDYKTEVIAFLEKSGLSVADQGTYTHESCDYPDYAHAVARMVESGKAAVGILICGSGNGVCMAANKHASIRAALCWTDEIATLARSHNDANVIGLPARFVTLAAAENIVQLFLTTHFEGGRHQRRVEKI